MTDCEEEVNQFIVKMIDHITQVGEQDPDMSLVFEGMSQILGVVD